MHFSAGVRADFTRPLMTLALLAQPFQVFPVRRAVWLDQLAPPRRLHQGQQVQVRENSHLTMAQLKARPAAERRADRVREVCIAPSVPG